MSLPPPAVKDIHQNGEGALVSYETSIPLQGNVDEWAGYCEGLCPVGSHSHSDVKTSGFSSLCCPTYPIRGLLQLPCPLGNFHTCWNSADESFPAPRFCLVQGLMVPTGCARYPLRALWNLPLDSPALSVTTVLMSVICSHSASALLSGACPDSFLLPTPTLCSGVS